MWFGEIYHNPRLTAGQPVQLEWQMYAYTVCSSWPISVTISPWARFADSLLIILNCIAFVMVCDAEGHAVYSHIGDIESLVEAMATHVVLMELMVRLCNALLKRASFKHLIDQFYQHIYVPRELDPELFEQIRLKQLPTKLSTSIYIFTLVSFFAVPIFGFFRGARLLPYPAIFRYDYTPLPLYIPTLLITQWAGVLVVCGMIAESNVLAIHISHLNARYLLLQRDLRTLGSKFVECSAFKRGLIAIIRTNGQLNIYARLLQQQYSFRIFVMLSCSAILLCVLGFKVATLGSSSENVTYISWIAAKVVELIIFGKLGTMLIHTTDDMANSYYCSGWELVVMNSANTKHNVEIMKLIFMAINLNKRPIKLSGMNFFTVSLETVLSILQGSVSYFTCLYAVHYEEKNTTP